MAFIVKPAKGTQLASALSDAADAKKTAQADCPKKKAQPLYKPVMRSESVKKGSEPRRIQLTLDSDPAGYSGKATLTAGAEVKLFTERKGGAAVGSGAGNVTYNSPATVYAEGAAAGTANLRLKLDGANTTGIANGQLLCEEVQINTVTPKIELEYKVVLLDRLKDKDHPVGPTYIQVSYSETNTGRAFKKGGALKCEPANVEMYLDEKCKQKSDGKLTNKQLSKTQKVYLKGVTAGKFTISLTLDDPEDGFVEFAKDKNPAKEEMGVIAAELKVHRFDKAELEALEVDPGTDPIATYHTNLKAKALPAQKLMTDDEKTKETRYLHEQAEKHFGRAKLLVVKLDAAHLPAGTDDYEIVVTAENKSGELALFDKEYEGASVALPLKVKFSELKTKEKEVWVEGKTATKKIGDCVLDAGMDRGAGGLAKTAKRNGDWAKFTVVKIKEVKFEFSNDKDKATIWEKSKKRFYVNSADDTDGRALKTDKASGRKCTVTATLTQAIKKVPIHFMLAADKKNFTSAHWGAGVAGGFDWGKIKQDLKTKDKTDRKKVLHVVAETDDKGVAKCEDLLLSRLGGEVYKIGAYMQQDAHLAKFVDGHADLQKRKPVLSTDEINVWRRAYIQISVNKKSAMPARSSNDTAFEQTYLEIKEIDEVKFDKSKIAGLLEHPKWQFEPGAGTDKIICVGEHNKAKFHGLFKAEKPATKPKCHLIMCDAQWDPIAGPQRAYNFSARTAKINYKNAAGNDYLGVFDPPLKNDLLISGEWEWNDGADVHTGTLKKANIEIRQARTHTSEVWITIPDKCKAGECGGCAGGTNINPSGAKKAKVTVELNAATGPWAGESGSAASPHCLIVIDSNSNNFNNTISHELGHMFSQVRDAANWSGIPDHPDQYVKRGGQGSHCKKSATQHATEVDQDGAKIYQNGSCIMFHVAIGNVTFCDNCKLDLRVRDLSGYGK